MKATIILGNPKYIKGNSIASKYYEDIKNHLHKLGVKDVTFDKGADYTLPRDSDLYIGHSRGVSRYDFLPEDKQKVFLKFGVSDGILHPIDKHYQTEVWSPGTNVAPPNEHFELIPEQKKAIEELINKIKPMNNKYLDKLAFFRPKKERKPYGEFADKDEFKNRFTQMFDKAVNKRQLDKDKVKNYRWKNAIGHSGPDGHLSTLIVPNKVNTAKPLTMKYTAAKLLKKASDLAAAKEYEQSEKEDVKKYNDAKKKTDSPEMKKTLDYIEPQEEHHAALFAKVVKDEKK